MNQKFNEYGHLKSDLKEYGNTKATINNPRCSKVFIINVISKLSEYVHNQYLEDIYLVAEDIVLTWYNNAKLVCKESDCFDKEIFYGGPPFFELDENTYWTEPFQLYGFIKSNFHNNSILNGYRIDSLYTGDDPTKKAR